MITGRILNRLSADTDSVDMLIPGITRRWFFQFIPLISTVILLVYATPWFLGIFVPLAVFYMFVQVGIVVYDHILKIALNVLMCK